MSFGAGFQLCARIVNYGPDIVRVQARTASAANSAPVVSHAGEGHGKVSFLLFFSPGPLRLVTCFLSRRSLSTCHEPAFVVAHSA